MRSSTKSSRCKDSEIIELWLQSQASPHTQSCYRRDYERLRAHARKPLAKLTLADLLSFAQFLNCSGLAPISAGRSIAAVKSLFGFLFRMRFIPVNFATELPLPRAENRLAERVLSEESVNRLLKVEASPRDRILLNLLYLGGLRVSEAIGLRWRNLHSRANAGIIVVYGKGGRTRSIALPMALWTKLLTLRATAGAEDPVFQSRSGKPLDRGRVRTILRALAATAGIDLPVSPHWLRHAHASHALDAGAPLSLVRDTLGHASISTTSAYLHARPGSSSALFLRPAEPKALRAARVAQQARRVARGKGRSGYEAVPSKKGR